MSFSIDEVRSLCLDRVVNLCKLEIDKVHKSYKSDNLPRSPFLSEEAFSIVVLFSVLKDNNSQKFIKEFSAEMYDMNILSDYDLRFYRLIKSGPIICEEEKHNSDSEVKWDIREFKWFVEEGRFPDATSIWTLGWIEAFSTINYRINECEPKKSEAFKQLKSMEDCLLSGDTKEEEWWYNHIPRKVDWKDENDKLEVDDYTEHQIYLITHVLFTLSIYGTSPISRDFIKRSTWFLHFCNLRIKYWLKRMVEECTDEQVHSNFELILELLISQSVLIKALSSDSAITPLHSRVIEMIKSGSIYSRINGFMFPGTCDIYGDEYKKHTDYHLHYLILLFLQVVENEQLVDLP